MQGMATQVGEGDSPKAKILTIAGEATVSAAAGLHRKLLAALEAADRVVVEIGSLTDCDLTLFQLLCAGCRYAESHGGRLAVAPADGGRLRGFAEECGFHPADGCLRKQGGCLLAKEEEK